MLKINLPKHYTHFEIQAYVYQELVELGYNVRGEVEAPYPGARRRAKVRFDLCVVHCDGTLLMIIEIKPRPVAHRTTAGFAGTRQGRRYSEFCSAVKVIYGMQAAQAFISDVRFRGRL